MATYSGKPVEINQPVETVFDKVSNIGAYQARIDSLPEEIKAKLGSVRFTDDAIVINAAPVGEIKFVVTRRESPNLIRLEAEQSPVPFGIAINLKGNESSTTVVPNLDVEIPMMLKPMVGGKMQEAADKFSEMIGNIFHA